jgi:GNAT superfamily N-acetyltransferase
MFDLEIIEAREPRHIGDVLALLRDYVLWVRRRYGAQDIIDRYFEPGEWESELADLTGHYGPPYGAILLALVDGVPAGCAMMRGIGEDVCEMKRLFVRPAFRGLGIARCLTQRLSKLAVARGYRLMRLETGPLPKEAERVYREMGFRPIGPYYAVAGSFKDSMLFFEGVTREIAARGCGQEGAAAAA